MISNVLCLSFTRLFQNSIANLSLIPDRTSGDTSNSITDDITATTTHNTTLIQNDSSSTRFVICAQFSLIEGDIDHTLLKGPQGSSNYF